MFLNSLKIFKVNNSTFRLGSLCSQMLSMTLILFSYCGKEFYVSKLLRNE